MLSQFSKDLLAVMETPVLRDHLVQLGPEDHQVMPGVMDHPDPRDHPVPPAHPVKGWLTMLLLSLRCFNKAQ